MTPIISNLYFFILSSCIFAASCVTQWSSKSDIQTRLLEDDELAGQVTMYLYHSLEPSNLPSSYVKRGIITVNSARNDATYIEENPLSISDAEKLKKLATSDGIYQVKLMNKPEETENNAVFSFTKACGIYESGLTDTITITLDQSYVPIGVSVSAVPPYCLGNSVSYGKLNTFNTTVNIVSLVNGPSPDTLTYIQRLEQEKAEKARGEQGDNRSFFAKYWMYIVPFVIFLFISGASGPEGQAGAR